MKRNLKLFCIALAILMIAAIVVKGIDTSWGAVSVKRASEVSPNGYLMNYNLQRRKIRHLLWCIWLAAVHPWMKAL